MWRSTLCEYCWQKRATLCKEGLLPVETEEVLGKCLSGERCRPTQVTMRACKTFGSYLQMPHWQKYDEGTKEWIRLPSAPTHMVHLDQKLPADVHDYLGMFGNEVTVIFSQQDDDH